MHSREHFPLAWIPADIQCSDNNRLFYFRSKKQVTSHQILLRGDIVVKTFTILCLSLVLLVPVVLAQTTTVQAKPISDTDIQLLRSDVQADKNQIIAHTMGFTDAESAAFWPVYRDYAREQQAIGDERVQVIKDYAKNFDALDGAKAEDMAQRSLNIDAKFLNLRQAYWPKFAKALGAKRAAKFYQVDNRLSLLINVQLASEIPLVP